MQHEITVISNTKNISNRCKYGYDIQENVKISFRLFPYL